MHLLIIALKKIRAHLYYIPNKDDTPARWRLKIAKSTAAPEWDCILDNGG